MIQMVRGMPAAGRPGGRGLRSWLLASAAAVAALAAGRPAQAANCTPTTPAPGDTVTCVNDGSTAGFGYTGLPNGTLVLDGTANGPLTFSSGVFFYPSSAATPSLITTTGTVGITTTFLSETALYIDNFTFGVSAADLGIAVASGTSIITDGNSSLGIWVRSNSSGSATVTLTGGSILTGGSNATAAFAQSTGGAAAVVVTGNITTEGAGAAAAVASGATGATVTLIGAGITTAGQDGYGGYAALHGAGLATVAIDAASTIATQGIAAHGAYALVDSGAGSGLVINAGGVTTGGLGAAGLYASVLAGDAEIRNTGSVATSGSGAPGILAVSGGTATIISSGSIVTTGASAIGVFANSLAAGPAIASITVSGSILTGNAGAAAGAYGAYATLPIASSGLASVTLLSGGSITTTGLGGFAAFADSQSGGDAEVRSAGSIVTQGEEGRGAVARVFSGSGNALVVNAGSVATAGLLAHGLEAGVESGATGSATVANTGSVTTASDGAIGLWAHSAGGNAAVTHAGSIATLGVGADGILVEASGAATITSSGSITATGAAASGIRIAGAAGGYTLAVTGGTITGGSANPQLGTGTGISIGGDASGAITIAAGATVQAGSGLAIQDAGGAMLLTSRGSILGNISAGDGNDQLTLEAGSVTQGQVLLGAGDDLAVLRTGADIAGVTLFDGGAGTDQLFLSGTGSDAIAGIFPGFEELIKNDSGTWTITGAITGPTSVTVQAGTLIITGDNSAYAGSVTVDPTGILQGRAQVLPQAITDNGLVRFAQTDDGTYAGLLTGTGAVEKTGAGILVLAPAAPGGNTYAGGTIITQGTLAIAADGAIGAATGPLTFNGGTLRFDAGFNLSAARAIAITAAGGTIDTNGVTTTIAQGITGPGALTVDGPGNLILTGANTYAGGTTINAGARVQLGAGGTTGSIAGNVLNNGTLAFNRSDTLVFAGAIAGSGAVRQEGTGTTILTGENTYTGGTVITAGTLQLGAGGTTGSILGNVLNNGTLAFNRSNTLTFAGVISGTGAVRQEGSGTTILTGANTYSGPTSVNAGTLQAGAAGAFSPGSAVTVAAAGRLALAGFDQTIAGLTNAGLVPLGGAPGTRLTVAGNYLGQGGVLALNTVLGGDGSASDRLVISGGSASGDTIMRITNAGGPGAQTMEGIRVVEVANGGTTAAGAFRLDTRVAAGAFEYRLFRGGNTGADDWFLRSFVFDPPVIPLYRPETVLYAPVAAIGRRLGLATLGTLHDRRGEETGIGDGAIAAKATSPYASGAWARVIGERSRSRWDGTVEARAVGNLIGLQAGFDILQTRPYAGGHRDIAGVYVAYADDNAPDVSGFALGQRDLRVGRLLVSGPAAGAYWTHFGPGGWYLDAVAQVNWFDVSARSDFGTGLGTSGTGYAASLEAGYPIRIAPGWQVEPSAQLVWQGVSVDRSRDAFSSVDWDAEDAVTGRIGARLQYTARTPEALWQPYAKLNLWHAFSGNDRVSFGSGNPIESRFGETALEVGAGVTAQVTAAVSFYTHADYRWSLAGDSRQTAVQGSIGIRVTW